MKRAYSDGAVREPLPKRSCIKRGLSEGAATEKPRKSVSWATSMLGLHSFFHLSLLLSFSLTITHTQPSTKQTKHANMMISPRNAL
jgi:hypothetical protein